jgi:hypothetical protein
MDDFRHNVPSKRPWRAGRSKTITDDKSESWHLDLTPPGLTFGAAWITAYPL